MYISSVGEKDNPVPPGEGEGPKLGGRHTIARIVITVALLIILVPYMDLAQVWLDLITSDKRLVLAALSHYSTYPVRGIRWRRSLNHIPKRCSNAGFGLLVFFCNFCEQRGTGQAGRHLCLALGTHQLRRSPIGGFGLDRLSV